MARQDFYAMLGVERDATADKIGAAYRAACTAIEQGSDPHGPDASNKLKFLRFAHETLLHEGRRAAYDASLLKPALSVPEEPPLRDIQSFPPRLAWAGLAVIAVLGAGAWLARSPARDDAAVLMPAHVIALERHGQDLQAAAAPIAATPAVRPAPAEANPSLSAVDLFDRNSPSIVVVVGLNGAEKQILQGSGVVVDDERVITNCHVAKGAASTLVKIGEDRHPATLLRVDPDPDHDLCLLWVKGLRAPAVALAAIDSVRVGQKVFALGAPRGLELTLSEGIVSSLRKHGDSHYVQTTASISPGSSGGGLFNDQGALIGITTFQSVEGQNLNFAVPVDWVAKLLGQPDNLSSLAPAALGGLPGHWRCHSSRGTGQMLYRFTAGGRFTMTRPEAPADVIDGSYAIAGGHTLVLNSAQAEPPEVYVQVMSIARDEMRLSSPHYRDAQSYNCTRSG